MHSYQELFNDEKHHIGLIGLNYRGAPLVVREAIAKSLTDSSQFPQIGIPSGALLLSTCHRIEVYVDYAHKKNLPVDANTIIQGLARSGSMSVDELLPYIYEKENGDVVRHVIEVAAGLHSMTLGEGQILTQVRQALESVPSDIASPVLQRLFQTAVTFGKRVRTQTRIGEANVSLADTALQKLKSEGVFLSDKRILVVGNGRMAQLVMKRAMESGIRRLRVACRRPEKVTEDLLRLNQPGQARALEVVSLDTIADELRDADLVFTATAAPDPVIDAPTLLEVSRQREHSLWIVDLALPRDVAPLPDTPSNLHIFTVDDLTPNNGRHAPEDLAKAFAITRDGAYEFYEWLATRSRIPIIKAMRKKADNILHEELHRLFNQLGPLSDEQQEALTAYSRRLTNKVLHFPTIVIKEGGRDLQNATSNHHFRDARK